MALQPALCRLDEIPDGQGRGFEIETCSGRRSIVVVRRGDRAFGYVNRCPHVGTPLDWVPDKFMSWDNRHLLCATHGALFRVEDGLCVQGPCSGDRLEPVPLEVSGGEVYPLP
jgi:nitrite reductase/ring-hydroxylating ferredoxin subunit